MRPWMRAIGPGMVLLLLASSASADPLTPAQADARRIQRHLAAVERGLREADVSHLDAEQRARRAAALDRLGDYWRAGVFPQNAGDGGGREPTFIDEAGRACAVGDLVIESGHADLARAVAAGHNKSRVPAIDTPGLGAWAEQHGFSVAELTAIQPGYCICTPDYDPVCGKDGLTYWNECAAGACAQEEVLHAGACARSEVGNCVAQAVASCGDAIGQAICEPEDTDLADPVGYEEALAGDGGAVCTEEKGCRCRSGPGEPGALWAAWLAFAVRRRRGRPGRGAAAAVTPEPSGSRPPPPPASRPGAAARSGSPRSRPRTKRR